MWKSVYFSYVDIVHPESLSETLVTKDLCVCLLLMELTVHLSILNYAEKIKVDTLRPFPFIASSLYME
jgi:hypothetical protein